MISDTAKGENFAKQINDMLEDTYGENIELDYEVVTKAEVEEAAPADSTSVNE